MPSTLGSLWKGLEASSNNWRLRGGVRSSGLDCEPLKVQLRSSLEHVLQGCSPLHLDRMLAG